MEHNLKKAGIFTGITFLLSWIIILLFFSFGGKWGTPVSTGIIILYMLVPMITAIIVQKIIFEENVKTPLGISFRMNRWFLVAWLLPPAIAFLTLGISLSLTGVEYSPDMEGMFERFRSVFTQEQVKQMKTQISSFPVHPAWLALVQGLIAGTTINAVFGFGEELGWRGLLLRELQSMGFWKSSVIIGSVWGIWHIPVILQGHNYPEHPVAGVFMMILWCILFTPVISYVRIRAGSVVAAAIMHGTLNATAGIAIMLVKGGNDLTVGVTGLSGFISLITVNAAFYLFDRYITRDKIMSDVARHII
ncbi:MAG: CPBP family intramembrane metalloprotease [Bacteroidales bacterium]|nr:CPBP family intramembrane metalloprotease [Bacteroidales bacterium]